MDLPHPQKDLVKRICRTIYYLGLGNLWYEYEGIPQSNWHQKLYQIWHIIANVYLFTFTINELLANLHSNLNDKEKSDLAQFTLAHICLSSKIVCMYIKREKILIVLERLFEGIRSTFIDADLDAACVKKSIRLCVGVCGITYLTLLGAHIDGIKVHFAEGIPIRTEVTYYPTRFDSGVLVNVLRFFIQVHWWFLVSTMLAIDCLCISCLVIVGYKFKILQAYFNYLREKVLSNAEVKPKEALADDFKHDFIIGIKMHDDALWCAKNVQGALGILYSVQVFESVVLLVMCLVKLVTVERNLVFLIANFVYILCVVLLTGAYMLVAGDVTHEASKVSTAMFHSGWELVSRLNLREMVLALQRSQVPVYMFAFGVIKLSYTNFISVIRSSYSFFAVMY